MCVWCNRLQLALLSGFCAAYVTNGPYWQTACRSNFKSSFFFRALKICNVVLYCVKKSWLFLKVFFFSFCCRQYAAKCTPTQTCFATVLLQVKQSSFHIASEVLSSATKEKPESRGSCHLCTCSTQFCANLDVSTEVRFQNKRTQVGRCSASYCFSVSTRHLFLLQSCDGMTEVWGIEEA